ncbi:MAG TPA: hypothetical protein VD903_03180 [Pseudonocardia sp.]|nr:hypothetical protein [Pseudonocardia sp.]
MTTPAHVQRMERLGVTPVPQARVLHEIGDGASDLGIADERDDDG